MSRRYEPVAYRAASAGLSPMAALALSTQRRRRAERRAVALATLRAAYEPHPWLDEDTGERYVLVLSDSDGHGIEYADQVEVLCEVVAERVRDGWAPVAIYDLDTGEQQLVAVEVTAHAFAAPEQEHNPLRPEPRA